MNKTANIAHRYLGGYTLKLRLARSATDDYASAQSAAHAVTAVIGDCGGGGPSRDRMADAAIRMIEHADAVDEASRSLDAAWRGRLRVIEAVGDRHPLWGEVLECIYVRGMSVSQTCSYLARDRNHPYERTSLYRLRDRALERAYEEMERLGLLDEVELDEEGA